MKHKPYKPEILKALLDGLQNEKLPDQAVLQTIASLGKMEIAMVSVDIAMADSKIPLINRLEYFVSVLASMSVTTQ